MKKVLVVDNEPQLADFASVAVINSGMVDSRNIHHAYSAELGNTCARSRFDLLLVDWDLGDGTGATVIATARKSNPAIKVAVLSGRAVDDNEVWESDPDIFVHKPYDLPGLTEVIKRLLAA